MNRNNEVENQMVSLFCIQLTAPDGTETNYYSGMVDLPAYNDGADGFSYESVYPGQLRSYMSYDSGSLTFTAYFQVNCSAEEYNPSTTEYQTFLLPFYTDNPALQPPFGKSYTVEVILLDVNKAPIPKKKRLGIVSTPQRVQPDEQMFLPLKFFPANTKSNEMGSLILNSVTQNSQYFVIIWTTVYTTVSDENVEVYPILYYPNNVINAKDQTPPNLVYANWIWSTSPGSGSNRNLPYPYPQIPNYMNTVGCMAMDTVDQYTGITMDDGSIQNILPYNPNGQYQV